MQGTPPPSSLKSTIKVLGGIVFVTQFFALLFTSNVLLAGVAIIVCIFLGLMIYVGVYHSRPGFVLSYVVLLAVYCAWAGLMLGVLIALAPNVYYNYNYYYCGNWYLYCFIGGFSYSAMVAISSILTVISWIVCLIQIIYSMRLYLFLKKSTQTTTQYVTYQTPQPVGIMPTAPAVAPVHVQVAQPQPGTWQ